MRFCGVCDNMLYIRLDEAGKLEMYCKNCSFVVQPDPGEQSSMCVFSSTAAGADRNEYRQFMNKDIKHDPTLPRVRHLRCPNAKCTSSDKDREVIYLKYDSPNMKYLYFCCACETFWVGGSLSTGEAAPDAPEAAPEAAPETVSG